MNFTEFFDDSTQLPTPVSNRNKTCYTDLYNILKYFLFLDTYAVKVENCPHNSMFSARSSIFRTIKRFNMPIRVRIINNELYLINTLKEDNKHES